MTNPLTGAPTIAPLAMLVDHVGGLVNHHRRTRDEWTVSSELSGTVRSFHINALGHLPAWPDAPSGPPPAVTLGERMAVRVAESGGAAKALQQLVDPVLNNRLGVVHGGVSAMALESVAFAAVNAGREDEPLQTASLRVNFIRPFRSNPESRYIGTALRVGRSSGIGEAQAIGADGEVAIIARVTAYG